jgi:hypothetical protein
LLEHYLKVSYSVCSRLSSALAWTQHTVLRVSNRSSTFSRHVLSQCLHLQPRSPQHVHRIQPRSALSSGSSPSSASSAQPTEPANEAFPSLKPMSLEADWFATPCQGIHRIYTAILYTRAYLGRSSVLSPQSRLYTCVPVSFHLAPVASTTDRRAKSRLFSVVW